MKKPRILVLAAAGKTGLPTALQLLGEGFPVTAFVRKEDARSERLRAGGAEIIMGSLTDVADMRRALHGVQRAYFCTPLAQGNLKAAAVFAAVAAEQEQPLESVVAMSQWLSSPVHPSVHTRETWLADRILSHLSGTALTLLNPGWFADNYMPVLPFAAQFGLLMLPYGDGRNCPQSNEDMGRVAAEILARPEGHAGKTYRPTGPTLLTMAQIADIFSRVLGRRVRYVNSPIGTMLKIMKAMGIPDYQTAQAEQYYREYERVPGAFSTNAPTSVVRDLTGREPEDFETILRRYADHSPEITPRLATRIRLMKMMTKAMLRPVPDTRRYLDTDDFSDLNHITLSVDAPEWRRVHESASASPLPTQDRTQNTAQAIGAAA